MGAILILFPSVTENSSRGVVKNLEVKFRQKICFNYYVFCSFHCSVTLMFRSWMCWLDTVEDRGQDTECLFIV